MNIQRVTNDGIDFITKKGFSSQRFADKNPVSILHTNGQYVAGEIVQQWRAEGICKPLDLVDIIHKASDYTIAGIVASTRSTKDSVEGRTDESSQDDNLEMISEGRNPLSATTEFTEIIQSTRNELEAGSVPLEELNESIQAFRFCPSRVELMVGGPDQVMWNRWEWKLLGDGKEWSKPIHILPH
eukprot:CAMPEP_0172501824 /NCGR_PEP_ID=MMETSP1066-20121228/153880_1 /TAXON_ID=671091 /ORGANISM="Coscinodiscus wailesii, Strain CCMP2513" /LENGTH=184 /DNA_ID=CAMNT_0013276831 /DNA_START=285 /DNA_END=839 /DNA_ORIENTATION=+